ncbi:hypothetical protein HZH66_013697 [Vespula vulgaris]|uniref:Uncharacterized protein n=1 Tax=Vespula vulgaris TaxID=7454 RepID=A0A834MRU9_VESVU|nr:hypothetical protein HZH66_013697 [Vespula vulgaris]
MNLVLNHHQMRKILDHKKLFGNHEIISDIFDYTNTYALQCDLAKPISVSANGIEHAVFLCPFTYYPDLKLVSEIRDKSVIVNTTIVNKSYAMERNNIQNRV